MIGWNVNCVSTISLWRYMTKDSVLLWINVQAMSMDIGTVRAVHCVYCQRILTVIQVVVGFELVDDCDGDNVASCDIPSWSWNRGDSIVRVLPSIKIDEIIVA